MRNSEMFGLGETGCEKFRNMMEVIEATNATLGVRLCAHASHNACCYTRLRRSNISCCTAASEPLSGSYTS